ncbi:ribulose-phosphate 3-epimerase [soil metagenome]
MIAPSILAADFSKLGTEVLAAQAGGANRIHIDVMDGHFVPNLSMGSVVCKGLRPVTTLPLEVHLMVTDPAKFIPGFIKDGADSFIFHLEVEPDPAALIKHLRSLGKGVGLAFNPDCDLAKVEPWLSQIDLALCMTVFPGFGGQAFIMDSVPRLQQLRAWINAINPKCELEVDGGIDLNTIKLAADSGANVFVAGTAIFGAKVGATAATRELQKVLGG